MQILAGYCSAVRNAALNDFPTKHHYIIIVYTPFELAVQGSHSPEWRHFPTAISSFDNLN